MRVAVNAAIVGERPTGLGIYAVSLIDALAALGERLIIYTSRPDLVTAGGVKVHTVSRALRPEQGARGHLARLVWVQLALRRRVRQARSDLLLNLMPEGLLAPALPQVTTVHDLLPLLYPAEYPRQQYYFRHYVPSVLRASDAIIVISESTRRDLLRFYRNIASEKVHVVLSGYDARRFTPDGPAASGGNTPYALYVGNVLPHKNLTRLVEAFASVASRLPCRLVLRGWGKPSSVRELRRRIETLGMAGSVDWAPYADADELPSLYRGARMLLLPSLHEGFGLTALEAMACGTVAVTSNTSSLPEVVGDAALLVDPLDVSALADAIATVFSDDTLVDDLRERGLARARAFSWEKTARAVQSAIRIATAGRSSPAPPRA